MTKGQSKYYADCPLLLYSKQRNLHIKIVVSLPPEPYSGASLCGGLSSPEYEYNNTQSNQTDQSILA